MFISPKEPKLQLIGGDKLLSYLCQKTMRKLNLKLKYHPQAFSLRRGVIQYMFQTLLETQVQPKCEDFQQVDQESSKE